MIVYVGGEAFQIRALDGTQWAVCVLSALPCLLWAIGLRCIPDKYAAALFSFVAKVWLAMARPVMKVLRIVFRPVGKGWKILSRTVFQPTSRFTKRTTAKLFKKKRNDEEELAVRIPKHDEESAGTLERTGSEMPKTPKTAQPAPPPITLTTPS